MPTLRFTAQLQITTAECPVTARNLSRKTAIAAILKAKGTQRNLKSKATCFQAHGGRRRLKNLSLSPSVTYARSRGVQARVAGAGREWGKTLSRSERKRWRSALAICADE